MKPPREIRMHFGSKIQIMPGKPGIGLEAIDGAWVNRCHKPVGFDRSQKAVLLPCCGDRSYGVPRG
jgi:hypothetical protein